MEAAFQSRKGWDRCQQLTGKYKDMNFECQSRGHASAHSFGVNVFDKGSPGKIYRSTFPGAGCSEPAAGDAMETRSGMTYFLCVLGMVLIVEGLPYFAFPARMKEWLVRIAATPDEHLRRIGLTLMVVGLGLVYVGRF